MKSEAAHDLPGVNIQYPISQEILNGSKTIETRTYPLPKKYVDVPILIVETPGRANFKARIAGIVIFAESFAYRNRTEFYADVKRHLVDENSPWAWTEKAKWGWPVKWIKKIENPIPLQKRTGIRFSTSVPISRSLGRELDRFLKSKR